MTEGINGRGFEANNAIWTDILRNELLRAPWMVILSLHVMSSSRWKTKSIEILSDVLNYTNVQCFKDKRFEYHSQDMQWNNSNIPKKDGFRGKRVQGNEYIIFSFLNLMPFFFLYSASTRVKVVQTVVVLTFEFLKSNYSNKPSLMIFLILH